MTEALTQVYEYAVVAAWALAALALLALVASARGWWVWRRRAGRQAEQARALERRLESFDSLGEGLVFLGAGGRVTYANAAAAKLLGLPSPNHLFGKTWRSFFPEATAQVLDREVVPALGARGHWLGQLEHRQPDGPVTLELAASAVRSGGSSWVLRHQTVRDSAEQALRSEAERYRVMVQHAGSPLLLLGSDRRLVDWNREAGELLPAAGDALSGQDFLELAVPEESRAPLATQLDVLLTNGGSSTFELPLLADGGRRIAWHATSVNGASAEGGFVLVGQDVTGLKQVEEALTQQESLFRLLANNASDLVLLHDLDGRVEYASPSCASLLGLTQDELTGRDPFQLSHSDDWSQLQACLGSAQRGHHQRLSLRLRTSSGEFRWFEMLIRPIRDDHGSVAQLQSSSRDIAERKQFEMQLKHQALHEPLTGLPNRTLFMDRVAQAMNRAKRQGERVAVMFIDLDRFKVINDSMGHAAGDRLISAVSRRVRSCVRSADTVARLGGDEFGVLLDFDTSEHDAATVAERILKHLEPPFTMLGTEVFVSASIGIVFSTPEIETPEDLLRYADVAMYRAKDDGSGRFRIYDPQLDAQATGRLALENELRQALERDELLVHYQPLVSLGSGQVCGLEALVRWDHPNRGLVRPDEFIALAEETGLIVPLGYWVMRRACLDGKRFDVAAGRENGMLLSVNLSTRQLEHPGLEREVETILRETQTDPARLQLEITETELMESAGRIMGLKALGVRIAIDDFGTGYSSLSYLRNLHVDSLKIDRSFVAGLGESREDTAIVQTVITLAEALGLDVTAEGVEEEAQLALLRRLECDTAQGYYFARPAPVGEVLELLKEDPTW